MESFCTKCKVFTVLSFRINSQYIKAWEVQNDITALVYYSRRGKHVEGLEADTGDVMALDAGKMSMHHTMSLHCSGPNTTSEPRVGRWS